MSFVYLISEGDTGPVKFGVAADPAGRLGELQTGNSRRLRLVSFVKRDSRIDAFETERDILNIFKGDRLIGEWLNVSEEFAEKIMSIIGAGAE